jgi:hypothetical protein
MSDDRHLFGLPGAEHMQWDLATVYEQWADDNDGFIDEAATVTIEEWTTAPLAYRRPEYLAEHVAETIGEEGDEWLFDALSNAAQKPDVIAAFQGAVDLMLSKVGYRMAAQCIATHVITHDAEGEPMLDGGRLYRPVEK